MDYKLLIKIMLLSIILLETQTLNYLKIKPTKPSSPKLKR